MRNKIIQGHVLDCFAKVNCVSCSPANIRAIRVAIEKYGFSATRLAWAKRIKELDGKPKPKRDSGQLELEVT